MFNIYINVENKLNDMKRGTVVYSYHALHAGIKKYIKRIN